MVAFAVNVKYLRLFLMWPPENKRITNPLFIFKLILYLGLVSFIEIGNILNLIQAFRGNVDKNILDMLENFQVICILIGITYIAMCFVIKQEKLQNLMNQMNNFQEFSKPILYDKINKRLDLLTFWYIIYGTLGAGYFNLLTLINIGNCEKRNLKYNLKKMCIMPTQLWYPFEVDNFVTQVCLYILHCFIIMIACNSAIALFCLICSICENIIMRIDTLKEFLDKALIENGDNHNYKMIRLVYCLRYHMFIINTINIVNECFRDILFLVISMFSLVLGSIAFEFTLDPTFKTLIHFGGWFFTLTLLSFVGQRVINESYTVTERIYSIPWYKADINIQKAIVLMMTGSHHNMRLEAGKFTSLSLPTLQMILKNTYSFIALLNMTVTYEEKI